VVSWLKLAVGGKVPALLTTDDGPLTTGVSMSENPMPSYLVRDPQGNVYGPADVGTLRQWVSQGRIIAGMHIAARETEEWVEVSTHPALGDLFTGTGVAQPITPAPTVPQTSSVSPVVATFPVTPVTDSGGMPVSYAPVQSQTTNIPGLISLIAGLLSVFVICIPFCGCLSSGVFSLTAIVLGSIALYQIKANPERYTGRGLAVAGLSLGIVTIVLVCAFIVVFVVNAIRHP